MVDKKLIKGGHVVSMDPDVGDLSSGDVLIEGDKIAAVGVDLPTDDAEIIHAEGDIVIPGFIDSHRHTWETAIRGCAPNATLDDYFVEVLDSFAPLYRPEDVHASNYAGALECINAGITTLLDWSHINNTPNHPDAGIQGLKDSGIRAVYAYGSANTSLADYWFESDIIMPEDDVRRIKNTYFSSNDGLLTMALATRGPGFTKPEVVTAEWNMARDLGIPITVHVGMGRMAGRFGMVKQLADLDLLGSDTTFIHSCYLSDEEWQMVEDVGATISIAAQVELQMGHGQPPTAPCFAHGLRPSLSIDVVTTVPGDMFTEMRAAFGAERVLVNAEAWKVDIEIPANTMKARDALEMATINGAHVVGLEDVTGSLTPGKQADVVIIDGGAINVAPVIDPVAAVVLSADVSNVDTVIIGGTIHKREGKLTADVRNAVEMVSASRAHLQAQIENPKPDWLPV